MKQKKISTSIYMIVFLLALCIAGTMAWFINYGTNKIDGTNVTVSSGNVMQVSLDGVNFTNSFTIDDFKSKLLNMKDITGDGKTFTRPVLGESLQEGNDKYQISVANPDMTKEGSKAVSTKECEENNKADYKDAQYISFDVYFRGTSKMNIYLTNNSSVSPNSLSNNSAFAANNNAFSKDWIAAASRISFVNGNEVKMVWAPLSDVKLEYDTKGIDKGFKIKRDQEHEEFSYLMINDQNKNYDKVVCTDVDTVKTINKNAIHTTIYSSVEKSDDKDQPIATLVKEENSDYYTGKVTVNIWIEGCDREARRALAGGEMNFLLNFAGFETK